MPNYRKSTGKGKYVALAVLLIVAGTVAALELTNTTHFFHKKKAPMTADQYTKGQTSSSQSSGSDSGQTNSTTTPTQPQDQKNTPSSGSYTTLVAPSGDFVSNHSPSLSNSDRNTESSVCTTTPGAQCVIMFINGSQTKSLASRTTDSGGSAYWDWKLQDIGLTTGSWRIKVVATLDGHESTAYDAQNLEVSQ